MRTLAALALGLLLPAAAAQTNTFVVPKTATAARGNTWFTYLFYYSTTSPQPAHVQLIWDTADVAIPAGVLKSLAFRRPNQLGNNNPAATANLTVVLSVGPNDGAGSSTTFASNLGPNQITVFSGIVNLPAMNGGGAGIAPFNIVLPFATVFPYIQAMGKGLVADVTVASYTPAGTNATWYLDGDGVAAGTRVTNWIGSKCLFSNGKYNNTIGHRNPMLGSTWYVSYQNLLPNAPGFGAVGIRGAGMTWGPIALPFDLGPLGAPNCAWAIDILITYALLSNASGIATVPTFPVPNDPALAGASYYDHALFVDTLANPLGLVSSWSSKWTIASGARPPGAAIYKLTDTTPPSPSGTLSTTIPVAEFGF